MEKLQSNFNKKNKKKKNTYRSKGAVTVFLTLVLVPTIVFAAVFTDVSRVQYSKTIAQSAADLALDSLIARYDEDLEQYYGMVASCQNIEEFYGKTTDYFAGMMRAEGISDANVAQFVDFMHDYATSGSVRDFLKTELDTAGIDLSDMDSQLDGNAALLENEIVEFMKYRGPIEISEKLIERFLVDDEKNVMGDLEDAEKNEPIVEAKQKYAEAEGEFLEKAFYTYLAIRAYEKSYEGEKNNESEKHIPDQESYNSLEEETKKIWSDYKELTRLLTNYYICSDGVDSAKSLADSVPNYPIDWAEYSKDEMGYKVTVEGTDKYYLSLGFYNSIYTDSDFQEKIDAVTTAAGSIRDAIDSVPTPSDESDTDEVVYLIKLKEALDGQSGNFSTIKNDGETLLNLYGQAVAALECEADPDAGENSLPDDWVSNLETVRDRIYDCWVAFLSPRSGETQHDSGYKTRIKMYISLAGRVKNNIDNENYTFTSSYLGRDNVKPSEFLNQSGPELKTLRDTLQKRHDEIKNALGKGEVTVGGEKKTVVPIMELLDLYNDYIQKTDEWGAAAYSEDTEYAQEEQVHYENVKTGEPEDGVTTQDATATDIRDNNVLTEETLIELKDRLTAIKDDMKKAIDAIDNFKYGETSIADISSLDSLIAAASAVIPSTSDISISVNDQASEGYFQSLIKPGQEEIYKAAKITDENNPDLSQAPPKLYWYFRIRFRENEDEIEQEISDNTKRSDEWKKQKEETEKKAKEADLGDPTLNGHGSSTLGASKPHGGGSLTVVSALSSILTTINDFANGGKQIRDKIYVIEYVMDMFSYSSYNTEGKFKLAGDGTTYKDFDSYNGNSAWENEDLTFPDNKSMTNRMINSTNNQFNLAEAEYVIFGNTDMKSCLNESYTGIYTIRFALDLISGFANFYTDKGVNDTAALINAVAVAIAAASQGIIPVSVTKCTLITVLSAFEAAKDLEVLKKGASVPLYKVKADSWYCAFQRSGDKDGTFGESNVNVDASGLYYSDYMYLFLLLNSSNYESMLCRIGDLVEANMRKTDGNGGFDLSKSRCFFKLTGDAKVTPLMLALPLVQNYGTGNLLNSDSWCSYDIKVIRGY